MLEIRRAVTKVQHPSSSALKSLNFLCGYDIEQSARLAKCFFSAEGNTELKMQGGCAERGIGSLWIFLSANSSADSALKIPASYIEVNYWN